jgi:hypothetical protein
MTFWRKTGRWSAEFTGVAFLLLGAFACFRSLERFYYAYAGPVSDDLEMRHINVTWEIEAWAIAAGFVIIALLLLRLARKLGRPNTNQRVS